MKEPTFKWLLLALLLGGLLMTYGCREKRPPDLQGALSPQGIDIPGVPYFNPLPGEIWKYKVEKKIPLGVALSPADASHHTESTDAAQLITFEQTRRCTGKRNLRNGRPVLTAISISENGKLLGEELYQINENEVLSWGWIPAHLKAENAQLLEKGVPLAKTSMRPGQSWESNGREPGNPFLFKVIEQEEVAVPAGIFQATRIQITNESSSFNPVTGKDQATSLKRTLWLAKDVGILKEETVYYSGEHVTVKQRSELVQWILPKNRTPRKTASSAREQGNLSAPRDQITEWPKSQTESERTRSTQP